MKTCKQCGQIHEDDMFRSYVPRGKGIYKTSVGRNTICKNCESLNNKASRYFKHEAPTEEMKEFLGRAAALYRELRDRGYNPVGVYARQVLGDTASPRRRRDTMADDALFAAVAGTGNTPTQTHIAKLTARSYGTLDEAIAAHDRLADMLRAAGAYEEADKLLEDWEFEEEEGTR